MRTFINIVRLMEDQDTLPVGRHGASIPILVNPSKQEMRHMLSKVGAGADEIALRGCYFPSDRLNIVFPAHEAIHDDIEKILNRRDEAYDCGGDVPYSGRYYVARSQKNEVVYVGNPDVVFADPLCVKAFDLIDLPSGTRTDYKDSEWGKPAREWDYRMG